MAPSIQVLAILVSLTLILAAGASAASGRSKEPKDQKDRTPSDPFDRAIHEPNYYYPYKSSGHSSAVDEGGSDGGAHRRGKRSETDSATEGGPDVDLDSDSGKGSKRGGGGKFSPLFKKVRSLYTARKNRIAEGHKQTKKQRKALRLAFNKWWEWIKKQEGGGKKGKGKKKSKVGKEKEKGLVMARDVPIELEGAAGKGKKGGGGKKVKKGKGKKGKKGKKRKKGKGKKGKKGKKVKGSEEGSNDMGSLMGLLDGGNGDGGTGSAPASPGGGGPQQPQAPGPVPVPGASGQQTLPQTSGPMLGAGGGGQPMQPQGPGGAPGGGLPGAGIMGMGSGLLKSIGVQPQDALRMGAKAGATAFGGPVLGVLANQFL